MPKETPYNVLRYAEEHNKALDKAIDAGGLDMFATKPGYTFIVPPAAILNKAIGEVQATKVDKCSTEWQKASLPLRRYILKGQLHPERMRSHHHYISVAQRDYLVYFHNGKFYLHEKEAPSADVAKGIELKPLVYTCMAQSVFEIAKDLPAGGEAKKPTSSRRKQHVIPCQTCGDLIVGGAEQLVNRYEAFTELKSKYGDKVGQFIAGTLMHHLAGADQTAHAACKALLTGNDRVDALMLLEPMAESPVHSESYRESPYLIADNIVTDWYDNSSEFEAKWVSLFDELIASLDTNESVLDNFFELKRSFRRARKQRYSNAEHSEKAVVFAEDYTELQKAYRVIAKNAFSANVNKYLHQRFGEQLPAFLYWKDTLAASYELMKDNMSYDNWLLHREYTNPGRNFQREFDLNASTVDADLPSLAADAINAGLMPYMRATYIDAFDLEDQDFAIHPLVYEYRADLRKRRSKKKKPKKKKKIVKKKKRQVKRSPKHPKAPVLARKVNVIDLI